MREDTNWDVTTQPYDAQEGGGHWRREKPRWVQAASLPPYEITQFDHFKKKQDIKHVMREGINWYVLLLLSRTMHISKD